MKNIYLSGRYGERLLQPDNWDQIKPIPYGFQFRKPDVILNFYQPSRKIMVQGNRGESVHEDIQKYIMDCISIAPDEYSKMMIELFHSHVLRESRYCIFNMELLTACAVGNKENFEYLYAMSKDIRNLYMEEPNYERLMLSLWKCPDMELCKEAIQELMKSLNGNKREEYVEKISETLSTEDQAYIENYLDSIQIEQKMYCKRG